MLSPSVRLVLDPNRLSQAPAEAFVVEKIGDYAPACAHIKTRLHVSSKGEPVSEIYVRHRAVGRWLEAWAVQWESIEVRHQTPRAELARRLQTEIPPDVSDADIVGSELLAIEWQMPSGQSFDDCLLEHFYGSELLRPAFAVARLAALLNQFDALGWKSAALRPVAVAALRARLAQWEKSAPNEATRNLIQRLRDEPKRLKRDVGAYKMLRHYPAGVGQKVIGSKAWKTFSKAGLKPDDLVAGATDVAEATTEIGYHLATRVGQIGDAAELASFVGEMSGHYKPEFYKVEELLNTHPQWHSSVLQRQIEQRFAALRDQLGADLSGLRALIAPPFPDAPDAAWDAGAWLTWARGSYMPYYAWLEAGQRADATVAGYAARFADWFYAHYLSIKNGEPKRFAFSALWGEREHIQAPDAVSLVLMVDNFNWVHFDELRRLFGAQGLSLEAETPLFSAIPTATETNKAGLMASDGNMTDHPSAAYPALVHQSWSETLGEKKAIYLPDIGALQGMKEREADLIFLNFLPIDEALHKNSRHTGQPHAQEVRGLLQILAKAVAEFAKRFEIGERLKVWVISDHGSTRIAADVVNVLDKSFYKELADKKHHRYLALSDEKFAALPPMVEAQCFLIDRHKFGTHSNYLAARGHSRFAATSDTFWVHGGLTPEEVVVPFARFGFAPLAPQNPTLRLVETEFRLAVASTVRLEVGNPNSYALTELALRLNDGQSEEIWIESLGAQSTTIVEFLTVFRKMAGKAGAAKTRELEVAMRFECQGREFTPDNASFEVTIKTLMEVEDDFDF